MAYRKNNNSGDVGRCHTMSLISFGEPENMLAVLKGAADLLGCELRLVSDIKLNDVCANGSGGFSDINFFHLGESELTNGELRHSITTLLHKFSTKINLCILNCEQLNTTSIQAVSDFLREFHDIIFTPCPKEEIVARIQRFCKFDTHSEQKINEGLVECFYNLNLIGQSEVFMNTLKRIKKIADFDVPILIQGETGTGKENCARAIHYLSLRKDRAFVPVNCAALPDELLESELFGYKKGAFTDAKNDQEGLVSIATGGTLLLDEIDCLTPKAQAALLRFLQTFEYRPLGGRYTQNADVRIICATNSCLRTKVQQHQFREDLLFRINVLHVDMPPLRSRDEDILIIAESLLKRFSEKQKLPIKKLSPAAIRFLMQHKWPGNVRELENTLLRQFLLADDTFIYPDYDEGNHPEESGHPSSDRNIANIRFQLAKTAAIEEFEQRFVKQLLSLTKGNVSEAARISGKERRALGKLIQKYNIDRNEFISASA